MAGAGLVDLHRSVGARSILGVLLLGSGACGSSVTAPPTPQEIVVEDDFERPTLGPSWTILNGDAGIVGSSDLGVFSNSGGPFFGLSLVAYTGQELQADQFSEIVFSSDMHPDLFIQVWVRRRSSDAQRYGLMWLDAPDRWVLKLDGGPLGTEIATVPGSRPQPGDTIRIEAEGQNLRGFLNGQLLLQVDDATVASGSPGIAISVNRGGVPDEDFPVAAVEVWRGGELAR